MELKPWWKEVFFIPKAWADEILAEMEEDSIYDDSMEVE